MKIIKILTVLVLLAPSVAYSQEVAKEFWVSRMKTALPAAFCNDTQYFRQCFNVTAAECNTMATTTTTTCLEKLASQIPLVLVQPKDGQHWGTKVGQCSGAAYESTLLKKRISNDRCNNISNWQ